MDSRVSTISTGISKFKNIFPTTSVKASYVNIKNVDSTANVKLKANELFFAVPYSQSIAVFPLKTNSTESVKIENKVPLLLGNFKVTYSTWQTNI